MTHQLEYPACVGTVQYLSNLDVEAMPLTIMHYKVIQAYDSPPLLHYCCRGRQVRASKILIVLPNIVLSKIFAEDELGAFLVAIYFDLTLSKSLFSPTDT